MHENWYPRKKEESTVVIELMINGMVEINYGITLQRDGQRNGIASMYCRQLFCF